MDEAAVDQALQAVYAIRVGLGLPAQPANGHDLAEVPPDLDQNFSAVRQALGNWSRARPSSATAPDHVERDAQGGSSSDFYKQDPKGNLDRILERLIPNAPAVKQAEAKLLAGPRATWTRPS